MNACFRQAARSYGRRMGGVNDWQKYVSNYSHVSILDTRVTSHNVIDQSMIINFEMKKIFGSNGKFEFFFLNLK
jgi:hypothetical protein